MPVPLNLYTEPDSADTDKNSIPPSAQSDPIAVAVVIQAGLLIILLPRQPDKLLQLMRVLFIQQVAPFIIFCAPRCCPFRADERQRQAAMVAVVQVDFSRRRVHRVHLVLHLLHGQAARCQPAAAFLTHPGQPGFHFPAGRASAPAPAGTPHCHRLRRRTAEGHPPGCGAAFSPAHRWQFRP